MAEFYKKLLAFDQYFKAVISYQERNYFGPGYLVIFNQEMVG